MLPVSTSPPTDLATLFDTEVKEILKLLSPGRRRRIDAEARLRPLTILDLTIKGEKGQPSTADLARISRELLGGKSWQDVFPGVSAVEIAAEGTGPTLSLRLSKKEGISDSTGTRGTPGASVVAVKRVGGAGIYNLGARDLAQKVGLTMPKVVAVVDYLGIRKDLDCYKEFKIGSVLLKRYSQKAIEAIKTGLKKVPIDEIWQQRKKAGQKKRGA